MTGIFFLFLVLLKKLKLIIRSFIEFVVGVFVVVSQTVPSFQSVCTALSMNNKVSYVFSV